MESKPTSAILLSTYNGAMYLPLQLQSLLDQTEADWMLCIRDDGSSDGTAAILQEFAGRNRQRIQFLELGGENLGARESFSWLLERAEADYLFFCDQDDAWHPRKMELSLERMRGLEGLHGSGLPLLVHSDLRVVDENMRILSNSFWRYQGLDPKSDQALTRLVVQNVLTGCTLAMNGALARLAVPVPAGVILHDWWVGLAAAAFGRIGRIEQPLVDYRQHMANKVGAKRWETGYLVDRLTKPGDVRKRLAATQVQAGVFADRFSGSLDPGVVSQLHMYSQVGRLPWLQRKRFFVTHDFKKNGFLRNAAMFFWI